MINHAFYKKASPVVKEATKIYFKGLEPSSKMIIDRFEAPIQTIRRIVGDDFYDLTNSKEDLINLSITDAASFNIESIKNDIASNNFNLMNDICLFVVSIYDRFARMYGNNVIGKEFEEVKFKAAITSPTKGLICKELSIKDFSPLSTFDDSGNVTGFIGSHEIIELQSELNAADQAAKKLQSTGGVATNAAAETITKKIQDLNEKLISKYMAIIETFFNLIKEWGEVEKTTDIFDATFIFNLIIVDDNSNEGERESIVEMDICSLHDIAHKHLVALKTKFD